MYLLRGKPEPDLKITEKLKVFLVGHWRGVLLVLTPIVFCFLLLPKTGNTAESHCYCGYTLLLMGIFWLTECLPLAITAVIPLLIFPLTGIMSSNDTALCFMNNTVIMLIGSLMLSYSVEQSGLHKRFAYRVINLIGFSHGKMLFGICVVTTFVSMWITNTAATTLMVPIVLNILRIFERQGVLKMYEKSKSGEQYASDITVCYLCCTSYSATIGGIGTLIGTATNLVFKGIYDEEDLLKEKITFPKYSGFAVPYMIVLEIVLYICLSVQFLGTFRSSSPVAKKAQMTVSAKTASKKAVGDEIKKLGKITFHEAMVVLLFGAAIISLFLRSPEVFNGWGDMLNTFYSRTASEVYIKDSACIMLFSFLMYLLPNSISIIQNCKAKFHEQLPKSSVTSVLDWPTVNNKMPYSFMILLGGGFALTTAISKTELNIKIGDSLEFLKNIPDIVIILIIVIVVILITNLASNVAVAYVFVPIFMAIANKKSMSTLWACVAAGISASHCFLLPRGTPGNSIVQEAVHIRTKTMVKCGIAPTVCCILITWIFVSFYAPVFLTK